MALNKVTLKVDIKALLAQMANNEDKNDSLDKFAGGLADIIDAYINTATVTATPAQITTAAMSNSGGLVVAANNLISTLN